MGIQEASRSAVFERSMAAKVVFFTLALGIFVLCEPVLGQGLGPDLSSPGAAEVSAPAGGSLNLPIPIPSSLRFYEGTDLTIDRCPRNQVLVNETCHPLLTQGPCQASDFVLLDPSTYEGYCAARLCAPDRIFVFSDQLCHDPFTSEHCPGPQELFQTAFGTPICQCPDGFLEGATGSCVPPLTPTTTCPPGQVLWANTSRLMQVCGPDPCGRLNLDRPLPSPPFVPSLHHGTCHQLGQVSGACPQGSFYALDLEARGGVCVVIQEAGYVTLDAATQLLYHTLYGPFTFFTLMDHTLLDPAMPLLPSHPAHAPAEMVVMVVDTQDAVGGGNAGFTMGTGQPHVDVQEVGVGGLPVGVGHGQESVFGSQHTTLHQAPKRLPHPRNHFIRGNNLGPVRQYKFDSLTKNFLPTRLDLARLHATRGQNLLVRPFPPKDQRGARPPVKAEMVPARLLAHTIYTHQDTHAETRENEDEQESLEQQYNQDSARDSQAGEEDSVYGEDSETSSSRRRRAAQSLGLVETRLVTCRAGARRHVNAKCRHTLLPFSSLPPSTLQPSTGEAGTQVLNRRVRSAAPLLPTLSCPQGSIFGLHRQCAVTTVAANTLTNKQ